MITKNNKEPKKPIKPEQKKKEEKVTEKKAPVKNIEQKSKEIKEEKIKSTTKTYHVAQRKEDKKWQVKFANGEKAIKLFDTQLEAIKYAENLAKNQEGNIAIHKKDGKLRKQTYDKK